MIDRAGEGRARAEVLYVYRTPWCSGSKNGRQQGVDAQQPGAVSVTRSPSIDSQPSSTYCCQTSPPIVENVDAELVAEVVRRRAGRS